LYLKFGFNCVTQKKLNDCLIIVTFKKALNCG